MSCEVEASDGLSNRELKFSMHEESQSFAESSELNMN